MPSPLFWIRFLRYGAIAFAILVVAGVAFGTTRPDPFEVGDPLHNSAPISGDQQSRGKTLRVEIEKLYADMTAHGTLKPEGHGRNFITDKITKYVPVGSSFEDAEAVLRAAGCMIRYPRGTQVRRPHAVG